MCIRDRCEYRALTERCITVHMAKYHKEKKFACKLGCGKMFDNAWYAGRHEKRYCVHSTEKDYWENQEAQNVEKIEAEKKRKAIWKAKSINEMNALRKQGDCIPCHICGVLIAKGGFKMHLTRMHANLNDP